MQKAEALHALNFVLAADQQLSRGIELGAIKKNTDIAAAVALLDQRVRRAAWSERLPRRLLAIIAAWIVLKSIWTTTALQ